MKSNLKDTIRALLAKFKQLYPESTSMKSRGVNLSAMAVEAAKGINLSHQVARGRDTLRLK